MLLTTSCGSTMIYFADAKPETKLYINGELRGQAKELKIPRTGVPKIIRIEAREDGKMVAYEREYRRFTFLTLVSGCSSYGAGLIFTWQYPKQIYLERTYGLSTSPTDSLNTQIQSSDTQSPWDRPPGTSSNSGSVWEKSPSKRKRP